MAEVYNKGKLDILQQEFKQWGRSTKTSVTFPIAFPNNCFTAIGMLVRGSKGEVSMNQPTKTGVQFNSYEDPWNWIAIGN